MTNPQFYDSNTAKYFTPEQPGWYVQYSTESGDKGVIKVNRRPWNADDALKMLQEIDDYEIWYVDYYAQVV